MTQGPGRAPASSAALSSLGAVGGARGTAAGAIRILVEFLTQYDSKAVKQLEADLAGLEAGGNKARRSELAGTTALATATRKRAEAEKDIRRLVSLQDKPSTIRRELKEIQNIGVISKAGQERLRNLDRELGLDGELVKLQTKIARQKSAQLAAETRIRNAKVATNIGVEQQVALEQQLSKLQNLKASVVPKLGGLALGALGGIVGGALLGVGFAAAQAGLELVGAKIQDIIDPSRHAKEEIKGIAEAINEIAASASGDRTAATIQFLKDIGIAADEATVKLLAQLSAGEAVALIIEEQNKVRNTLEHSTAIERKNLDEIYNRLLKEAIARKEITFAYDIEGQVVESLGDRTKILAAAQAELNDLYGLSESKLNAAAAATAALEAAQRRQAAAAQLAAFAEQNLVGAFQRAAGSRAQGFFDQAQALQDSAGPSAKTSALEAQIEKLQNAGSGGRSSELKNIADERAVILLRQRLRLLGTAVDLEKYSGKFLLEAIKAKTNALQKEAAAQDRLNSLLDLQFRMSRKIRRNEGETITDFLERRAQENRGFLSEQRDLERQVVEERLKELEDKTSDEVALAELAERQKNASAQAGTQARLKELQKQLQASQKADSDALKSRVDALNAQGKAAQEAADTATEYFAEAQQDNIRAAISASKTIEDLMQISAQIQGTAAALGYAQSFGQALVDTGQMTQGQLTDLISNLQSTLGAAGRKRNQLITGHASGRGPLEFASGGLINLKNSSSPFGSNVRFGEQGTEMGLILQNKVAQGIKDSMKNTGDMTFYMQKGDDWMRDRYEMKKLVREAVSEALR